MTHVRPSPTTDVARIVMENARSALASFTLTLGFVVAALYILNYSSVFDLARYRDAGPTIMSLLSNWFPPTSVAGGTGGGRLLTPWR